jgi:transposase-like protein
MLTSFGEGIITVFAITIGMTQEPWEQPGNIVGTSWEFVFWTRENIIRKNMKMKLRNLLGKM